MVEFFNVSSSTIGIRFSAWSRENSGEEMPDGYIAQLRKNGSMIWIDTLNVDHNADVTYHSVILEGLEPGTVYYVRIVPFINDAGGSYRGDPTEDASFETLSVSKWYHRIGQIMFLLHIFQHWCMWACLFVFVTLYVIDRFRKPTITIMIAHRVRKGQWRHQLLRIRHKRRPKRICAKFTLRTDSTRGSNTVNK